MGSPIQKTLLDNVQYSNVYNNGIDVTNIICYDILYTPLDNILLHSDNLLPKLIVLPDIL